MTRFTQLSFAFALAALAAAAGCSETQTTAVDQRAFDRPTDIAFACYGELRTADSGEKPLVSAMPTSACETRAQARANTNDPPIVPAGQEGLTPPLWYGLVLQSGPGTVNLVSFTVQPASTTSEGKFGGQVYDASNVIPGSNGISVGKEPVAIVTDPAGCHAITANAGSCDLSVIDLNSALDNTGLGAKEADPAIRVDRLAVKNASGVPILARPAAMLGEPSSTQIGNACPAAPTGLVYIAYPSCHLVAGVDTSTGTIVTGIQYDAAGVPSIVDGNVTCPAECGGGGSVTPGVRPVTLDLEVGTTSRRLAIGADNSASITVVDLSSASRPASLFQVALEDTTGSLGVSALALSPETGMGGGGIGGPLIDNFTYPDPIDDEASGGLFQFVYAVANDGTVRVADVQSLRQECDTQVDPRFARNVMNVSQLSCFPVGAPLTPPRRTGARGPGIQLPGSAIPLAVEFSRIDRLPLKDSYPNAEVLEARKADTPATLVGTFAVVTSSNGSTYVVNVDDDDYPDVFMPTSPLAVSVPLAMAHQLRDGVGQRSVTIDDDDKADNDDDDKDCNYAGSNVGGPRVVAAPTRTVPAGSVAEAKLPQLPGFRQILCDRTGRHSPPMPSEDPPEDRKAISELQYAAPADVRDRSFPDLMALPQSETWSLVWEGSLSLNTGSSDVDGPGVREGMLTVDSRGLHLLDEEKPFCEAGVEPFDILQLRGCDPSIGAADCPSGYTCFVHPDNKIQNFGTCMLAEEADRLASSCKDFLTTFRRYTIKTATSGELVAVARRHELRTTPLDGCVSDNQCKDLADYAERSASGAQPVDDKTPADKHTWACVADPERAPMGGTGNRCELRCDPAVPSDCVAGTVCKGGMAGTKSGFCMEGVVPSQSCINATQRYELRAGEAFAVIGSTSGFIHPIIADASGKCVRDPAASRLSIGRLPLMPKDRAAPNTLHMCDPTADPLTGQLSNGTFEPNPCLTTVTHTESVPAYKPNTCTQETNGDGSPRSDLVDRQAPAVRFRNRNLNLTLVDPYYPGDKECILDRKGLPNLGPLEIPHVVPGTTLSFRQVGGFSPMQVLALPSRENWPSFPVKVVRGPANSLWVLDEGDFLSTAGSTRGKVFRLEPLAPGGGLVFK